MLHRTSMYNLWCLQYIHYLQMAQQRENSIRTTEYMYKHYVTLIQAADVCHMNFWLKCFVLHSLNLNRVFRKVREMLHNIITQVKMKILMQW